MELRTYREIANTYRGYLLLIPLIAAVVALIFTYALPASYVGTATVQIIPDEIEPRAVTLRTQEQGPGSVAVGLTDPTAVLAQGIIEMLASREVAKLVVADLSLEALPGPQGLDAVKSWVTDRIGDAWALVRYGYVARKEGYELAVDRTQRALAAKEVAGSYYMKISATSRDPGLAADMANSAVRAVLQHSREIAGATTRDRVRFLEFHVGEAKERAERARNALLEFSAQSDAVQGDSLRGALANLESARATLRQADLALIDLIGRLAQVEDELARTASRIVTVSEGSSSASRDTSRTTVSGANPVYISLGERASALRQEIAAVEARRASTEGQVKANESIFRTYVGFDSRLASLNQELALANEIYGRLVRDHASARVEQARTFPLVRQIDPATPADYPSFPVKIMFVGFGAAAGLVAALIVVFVMYNTDQSLRSAAEVQMVLGQVRLLAVVSPSDQRPADSASPGAQAARDTGT